MEEGLVMSESLLSTDDLEPSSVIPPEASVEPTTRRPRARSTVSPVEAGAPERGRGGRKSQVQLDAEAEAAREKTAIIERKRVEEMRTKIRETCEDMVNPLLAKNARTLLRVPPEFAWMAVVVNDEHEPILKKNGMPQVQYHNGAQFVILQADEIEMLCVVGPYVMTGEVTDKAKAFAKKAAPFVMIGGGLMFAANYAMRLKQTKQFLDGIMSDTIPVVPGDDA
jgi:hypothetical protein